MPDPSLLQVFPNTARHPIVIEHVAEEFTSLCPMTGHPDFGVIRLRYQPAPPAETAEAVGGEGGVGGVGGVCVELKSLKLYYQSFRSEGIFYEAATARIRDDLAALLRPAWLQVISEWRGRGGIRSVIRADFGGVPPEYRANTVPPRSACL